MDRVEALVFREAADVERRLAELQLGPMSRLLRVADIAKAAGADVTPHHAVNAQGTLAYQYGTWALRDEFVGPDWKIDRPHGVEAIANETLKVRVVFQNVNVACSDTQKPQPRSPKGSGAERISLPSLFGNLPEFAPAEVAGSWRVYYLMVDENGAVELTRAVVKGQGFTDYVERIYLSTGGDGAPPAPMPLDDSDIADDFDPQVVRK